jgi:hypothetical protein
MLPRVDWKTQSIVDVLVGYKNSLKTLEEEWPDAWQDGIAKGKGLCLMYENIRTQPVTMDEIMAMREDTNNWWQSIEAISEQEYSKRQGERGQY